MIAATFVQASSVDAANATMAILFKARALTRATCLARHALQEGPRPMTRFRASLVAGLLLIGLAAPAAAAPEGTMTWGVHITLASRWLDPAETEGIITPFMVLYALHDALVKPMPAGIN